MVWLCGIEETLSKVASSFIASRSDSLGVTAFQEGKSSCASTGQESRRDSSSSFFRQVSEGFTCLEEKVFCLGDQGRHVILGQLEDGVANVPWSSSRIKSEPSKQRGQRLIWEDFFFTEGPHEMLSISPGGRVWCRVGKRIILSSCAHPCGTVRASETWDTFWRVLEVYRGIGETLNQSEVLSLQVQNEIWMLTNMQVCTQRLLKPGKFGQGKKGKRCA